jgi:membrane protease YdiL (CAAX protease family)
MNNSFKPASFLSYVLTLIAFFFIGMFMAQAIGAAEGQGLAGSTIVLFYGLVTAVIALIVVIIIVSQSSLKVIKKINLALGVMVLVLTGFIAYRVVNHSDEAQPDSNLPSTPTPTEVPAN